MVRKTLEFKIFQTCVDTLYNFKVPVGFVWIFYPANRRLFDFVMQTVDPKTLSLPKKMIPRNIEEFKNKRLYSLL